MTFQEYEDQALSTAVYPRVHRARTGELLPVYCAMAVCGEAGEFSEKIKKAWRDDTDIPFDDCLKELGDVLWCITGAAKELGYTLEQVAQANLDKVLGRRKRGTIHGSGDNR